LREYGRRYTVGLDSFRKPAHAKHKGALDVQTGDDSRRLFADTFHAMTGYKPLAWQTRLFGQLETGEIPAALDLPTGLGKTSVMAIWYLARRAGADLPRRLVYVVDRRAVVDQATEEAEKIRDWAETQGDDLPISTLRGQYADNRKWLNDPAGEAVIVGTVDMIGSRLLFEGYGASRTMRPYMAGLLGVDTLVVLDESHLVPPFERLLEQVQGEADLGAKDEADRRLIPRFRLLPLSATGGEKTGDVFRLEPEDREDPVVRQRLNAKKRLRFEPFESKGLSDADAKKTLVEELATAAWNLCDEGMSPARILVYCNSREVAGKVKDAIESKAKGSKKDDIPAVDIATELLVGARRVKEREDAKKKLAKLGFFSKKDKPSPETPAFVIATSAGEVGVDLDADHKVMDLVPFERMVQRLGRVNRLGEQDSQVVVVHGDKPEPKKKDAPTETEKRDLLAWEAGRLMERHLPRHDDGSLDVSPGALVTLKKDHGDEVTAASTAAPLYPALTRPLVDAWSMTSLKDHSGRPEIQPWLRGWEEDDQPQTTLVWRRHLPVRTKGGEATPEDIDAFFAAARPHMTETLETETGRVHKWLLDRAEKLAATFEKERLAAAKTEGDNDGPEAPPPLGVQKVVAILPGRRGEKAKVYTADYLARAKRKKRDKDALERDIRGRTLILDARMRGLSEDGLFKPSEDKHWPQTFDSRMPQDDEARVLEDWQKLVGIRIERRHVDEEAPDNAWRELHRFDVERDGDGEATRQLIVEKWRGADPTEDARSIARVEQSLEDHQEWAERAAKEIVDGLHLPPDIEQAVILAAKFHDEGKRASVWQRAFSAKPDKIYAKTTGPFRKTLHGYRHEFGSLLEIEGNNTIAAHPERDLILHLIAAHHGNARPVISTNGCDQAPPEALEERARDIALRFARLQKRFGPWGLAWLEALMRAADRQASRDLEEGRTPDG